MIILLKNDRVLAFPQVSRAEYESGPNNNYVRLILRPRANGKVIAEFNFDAVACVFPNDEDYINMFGAELIKNFKGDK